MKKMILGVIVAVLVLLVGGYFVFSGAKTTGNTVIDDPSKIVTINVDANNWQYSPSLINVKKGDHVRIVVNNVDKTHGIAIPDYNVNGIGEVDFIADKAGTFEFHCPTYCGPGHKEMTGTLVVS